MRVLTFEEVFVTRMLCRHGNCERITNFLRTLSRHHKKKQAAAFTRDELFRFLRDAPNDGKNLVDKLIVLCGFYGGLRSTEIVTLTWEEVAFTEDGMLVTIGQSKTDRAGIGAVKLLPKLDDEELCPVHYFRVYEGQVKQTCGRLFCQYRQGTFTRMAVGKTAIANVPKTVASFLKLENPTTYTGHSLRVSSASDGR